MIVLGPAARHDRPGHLTGVPRFTFGVRELYGGLDFVSSRSASSASPRSSATSRRSNSPAIVTKKVEGLWLTKRRLPPHPRPGPARHRPRARCSACCPAAATCWPASRRTPWRRSSRKPEGVRHGRHRGRRGARVGQQRRGADVVHPAAHPRPAGAPGDGAARRRLHHPGHHPGPNVINDEPELFWGLIASMWVGNLLLVLLNLPLIGIWVKMLTVPYRCCSRRSSSSPRSAATPSASTPGTSTPSPSSASSATSSSSWGCEAAPLLLGFVLGPLLEENLRRAMIISPGRPDGLPDPADLGVAADPRRADHHDRGAAVRTPQARGRLPGRGRLTDPIER